ncbi:MAG: hypothetical protein K2L89_07915 [Muribaculaceae bacterium]|nr:hypothetical protein [Muribaculaceae bacterium]
MKKNIIVPLFLLSLFSTSLMMAEERNDTIGYIINPKNIEITQSESKAKIFAEYTGEDGKDSFYFFSKDYNTEMDECEDIDNSWNFSLPYYRLEDLNECELKALNRNKNKIRRFLIGADHIYFGWRFNYSAKGLLKNSFETGIRNIVGIGWQRGLRGPIFSIGLGMGIAHFDSKDHFVFSKEGDRLILSERSSGKIHSYSDIYSFKIPLTVKQAIGRFCSFSVGASINLNFYASAETKIKGTDTYTTTNYKGLQQRIVSGELFTSVNILGVGLYASWQPFTIFEPMYGPAAKGWSIGIDIISM